MGKKKAKTPAKTPMEAAKLSVPLPKPHAVVQKAAKPTVAPPKQRGISPDAKKASTWTPKQETNAAEMDSAVESFRTRGDFGPLLRLIGGADAPQFAIQRALSTATRRSVRDALEDLGFLLAQGKKAGEDLSKWQKDVEKGVREEYGPHAADLVRSRIAPLLSGLLATCTPTPPLNCVVAILGIEARETPGVENIRVGGNFFGQGIVLRRPDCSSCGGQGRIVCPHCLELAKTRVANHPAFLLHVALGEIKDNADTRAEHARMLLEAQTHHFGCVHCHHQPIRVCECAREVQIPERPREGEILKGNHAATGEDWYCCVHLD